MGDAYKGARRPGVGGVEGLGVALCTVEVLLLIA